MSSIGRKAAVTQTRTEVMALRFWSRTRMTRMTTMTTLNCLLHCIPIVSIVARRSSKENECARRVIRSRITVTFIRVTDSARKPRVSIVTTGSNPARCRTVTTRRVTIVPIAFKDIIVTRVRHRTIQGAVRPPVVRDVTTTSVTLVLIMASRK